MNSRDYEWADITLILGGRDILTVRAVKTTKKIEREAVFGKGRKPIAIQSGNETCEGEFAMLKRDYDVLCDAGGGSILSLSLDALVSYGNPSRGDALRTNRIVGIKFTEETEELKQGDKFQEVTLPFLALDIIPNV